MKAIKILILLLISTVATAQIQTRTVDFSTLAGTDTLFIFGAPDNAAWFLQLDTAGLTGTGSLNVYITNDRVTYAGMDDNQLPITVSSTMTHLGVRGTAWGGKYCGVRITKGTLSAGTLTCKFNVNTTWKKY